MSFRLRWAEDAEETFTKIQQAAEKAAVARFSATGKKKTKSSKQQGLFKQVAEAVRLLGENPRHGSLNTHEFDSLDHPCEEHEKVSEAYAENKTPGAYRISGVTGPSRATSPSSPSHRTRSLMRWRIGARCGRCPVSCLRPCAEARFRTVEVLGFDR